ncbi:hypothetical protein SEA_WATERT_82 [Microbacterium phage WaterT]|nr:hypothetical protein SEA_WATERT_82 [Microbacterium phage WaterT]
MTDDKILILTYTEVTVRVPGSYYLDRDEYREWYAKQYPWRGDPLTDYDWGADEVLEFLNHSPDLQLEVWKGLPDLDTDKHDIMESNLVEVEFA